MGCLRLEHIEKSSKLEVVHRKNSGASKKLRRVFQPWQSPYNSMDGNPINLTDVLGLKPGEFTKEEKVKDGEGAEQAYQRLSNGGEKFSRGDFAKENSEKFRYDAKTGMFVYKDKNGGKLEGLKKGGTVTVPLSPEEQFVKANKLLDQANDNVDKADKDLGFAVAKEQAIKASKEIKVLKARIYLHESAMKDLNKAGEYIKSANTNISNAMLLILTRRIGGTMTLSQSALRVAAFEMGKEFLVQAAVSKGDFSKMDLADVVLAGILKDYKLAKSFGSSFIDVNVVDGEPQISVKNGNEGIKDMVYSAISDKMMSGFKEHFNNSLATDVTIAVAEAELKELIKKVADKISIEQKKK